MTTGFEAAFAVEISKLRASGVVKATTGLMIAGIGVLTGSLTLAAEAGDEQILAQLGDVADREGWALLFGIGMYIAAAASLLGFGTVLAWSIGREFADGTITGLFSLPVTRRAIAAAKLAAYLVWAAIVAAALIVAEALVGLAIGLGAPGGDAYHGAGRLVVLVGLTALLAFPSAWVATLGRSLLPGIATAIVIIVVAQVTATAGIGAGAWFPFTSPALWAIGAVDVAAAQLVPVAVVPVVFAGLTMRSWHHLELDH